MFFSVYNFIHSPKATHQGLNNKWRGKASRMLLHKDTEVKFHDKSRFSHQDNLLLSLGMIKESAGSAWHVSIPESKSQKRLQEEACFSHTNGMSLF